MSNLVGPDGQTPLVSPKDKVSYTAGGLRLDIPGEIEPTTVLKRALAGAQQMIGQQAAMQEYEKTGSQSAAQIAGQTAAGGIRDPFSMEPCALAVFMYMAREIEFKDRVIADMAARLDALDGKTTDLEHPYPASQTTIENVGEEEGEQADSSDKN